MKNKILKELINFKIEKYIYDNILELIKKLRIKS